MGDSSAETAGEVSERRIVGRIAVGRDSFAGHAAVPEIPVDVFGESRRAKQERGAEERAASKRESGTRYG
jgi:hypothetical protein